MKSNRPYAVAIEARTAPLRTTPSNYPEEFAKRMRGREKRPLGSLFGIENFGANLTSLAPGAISALRHAHSCQDEFIYVLQGTPTLRTNEGDTQLAPGMCAGFAAGTGNGHQLLNLSADEVVYFEVGNRSAGDEVHYPDDDLQAISLNGRWQFTRKNGEPYR
jgi:uncharacterized cupin superfamily protein